MSKAKKKVGRPTVMTDEVVNKLEHAFSIGCSDLEACFYADISKQTLYNYQDEHPEFIDRKERLKKKPVLMARTTLAKSLSEVENAKWYLTRKRKKEFGSSVTLEGGEHPIKITVTDKEDV